MKVELKRFTHEPMELITDIASICYGKDKASNPEKLFTHLLDSQHDSVLEHAYYTFKITGISRACLAQLTRHRHASFTVRSQRYCNEEDAQFVVPENIESDEDARRVFHTTIAVLNSSYKNLIDSGVKKEDARMILPQAITTDLYMSCNLRELRHIFNLRASKQAQQEVRELAIEMVRQVVLRCPQLDIAFQN